MPETHSLRRRILYKDCPIADFSYCDLSDIWDELYVGAKLALVRQRGNPYDNNAVAVALACDYDASDPEGFDFEFALGYVPRTENGPIAALLDLGWDSIFECEISQINNNGPLRDRLHMAIYMVEKEEEEEDKQNRLHAVEFNDDDFTFFIDSLNNRGCACFRWGGFPPWERDLPDEKGKFVVIHRSGSSIEIYLTFVIAVDYNAAPFLEEKSALDTVDDCTWYVLTNIKGPLKIPLSELSFLENEKISLHQPERRLSKEATERMIELLSIVIP